MRFYYLLTFLLFLLITSSCTKDVKQVDIIKEKSLNLQFNEAYTEGLEALDGGDVLYAAKKFNEAESLFPQSDWAPRAALMAAYSYYTQDYYGDAIAELIRFKKVYPFYKQLDYVNYMLAICYYEQIVDEEKDLQSLISSKKYFKIVINEYPESDYTIDAKFKVDYINDILAAKEMYIGRYYLNKKKWIGAINRFKTVIDDYETTIYTEEALHRLVEVYYILGLSVEAEKYAMLLGYNYKSSEWYENSYSIFNKDYEISNKIGKKQKEKNSYILEKFKSLFE
ncbi:outer membrane protein assembly factor BamD [Candidatus Pelagibacter sp. HIMB1746]|uniref:outer membrane protein assembly factor BamD n=1 Tax=Candidatus Pelagibacter sp. HIMB1746 TaxID=3413370 RepID=UPI003F833CB5